MLHLTAFLITASVSAPAETPAIPAPAIAFIEQRLKLQSYRAAVADLNGDGRSEIIIYAEGPQDCGSGGCDLYVLTSRTGRYALIADVSVSWAPIRILDTKTNGWRDIGVQVAGGGIAKPFEARLQFNGRAYPSNPTVPPVKPSSNRSGRIVIK